MRASPNNPASDHAGMTPSTPYEGMSLSGGHGVEASKLNSSAVIWITGYSGAGKTTVGRKVRSALLNMGIHVVFLDGDDLRGIFGGKWGYTREERIELAHTYFRLCNTLASQGVVVVISAVAMYNEVYSWVETNIDRSMQVYLKVPPQERVARDKVTKNIYGTFDDLSLLYDDPVSPDLVIKNYGSMSPDEATNKIIELYKVISAKSGSDKGRTRHWNEYYTSAHLVFEPSSFALNVSAELKNDCELLEIGCGNGRDAAYFSRLAHRVTALDPSESAIELCKQRYSARPIKFQSTTLPEWAGRAESFDVVYSRFCLHAMTEEEEIRTLDAAFQVLRVNGSIFIECRSINDPLARKGEVISPTERIYGHYRRFIVFDDLKKRLSDAGFTIESAIESSNLAALGEDNPVVIRIHAKKVA